MGGSAYGHRAGLTYEIHGNKRDFDLTPGQNLTLNWGVSQYLPFVAGESLLMELGAAGYDSWQITDDSGTDARNPSVHDQVHGIGGQLGLTFVPWTASLNVRYMHEVAAEDRFRAHRSESTWRVSFPLAAPRGQ